MFSVKVNASAIIEVVRHIVGLSLSQSLVLGSPKRPEHSMIKYTHFLSMIQAHYVCALQNKKVNKKS